MEDALITSRKNRLIVESAALSDKKARDESKLFIIEGAKLLEEALNARLSIERLFYTASALARYGVLLEKIPQGRRFAVTQEVYARLSQEKAPQGLFACAEKPSIGNEDALIRDAANGSFILLDEVQNPTNIGAILRSAFAFGFEKTVFCGACADPFSPKGVRAAMGSLFRVKHYVCHDAAKAASILKNGGVRVFCTALLRNSKQLCDVSFLPTDSFIIGNEGHGVQRATMEACDDTIYIPMNEKAESLNASTAAAIVMWEMRKKRAGGVS